MRNIFQAELVKPIFLLHRFLVMSLCFIVFIYFVKDYYLSADSVCLKLCQI